MALVLVEFVHHTMPLPAASTLSGYRCFIATIPTCMYSCMSRARVRRVSVDLVLAVRDWTVILLLPCKGNCLTECGRAVSSSELQSALVCWEHAVF